MTPPKPSPQMRSLASLVAGRPRRRYARMSNCRLNLARNTPRAAKLPPYSSAASPSAGPHSIVAPALKQIARRAQISIVHAARHSLPQRGFLPWRFSDAGHSGRGTI